MLKRDNCVAVMGRNVYICTVARIATIMQKVLTICVAVLLLGVSGGIGTMRCACSGRVSLLLPSDLAGDDCCRRDAPCMAVEVQQLDDFCASPTVAIDGAVDLPTAWLQPMQPADNMVLMCYRPVASLASLSPPGGRLSWISVWRV